MKKLVVACLAVAIAVAACVSTPATTGPDSDAPESGPRRVGGVQDPPSYAAAIGRWRTPQEVAEWIGAHFAHDSPRSIALSETQRSSGAGFSIHAPDAFFSKPRGVCVDLARFGVETLRSISPELEPAYLMIEFEPTLLGANLLRRHWVASFKRGGKHYFFADSKRPGHIAGPFATTSEFVAEYAHYRGRTILGFKERPTYQRQSKVRARRLP